VCECLCLCMHVCARARVVCIDTYQIKQCHRSKLLIRSRSNMVRLRLVGLMAVVSLHCPSLCFTPLPSQGGFMLSHLARSANADLARKFHRRRQTPLLARMCALSCAGRASIEFSEDTLGRQRLKYSEHGLVLLCDSLFWRLKIKPASHRVIQSILAVFTHPAQTNQKKYLGGTHGITH